MSADFTLEAYRALLSSFSERGYATVDFSEVLSEQRHLLLRHDLDMSIEAALQVARVEHAIGMKATYFVLLRTEFYNPFSEIARETLFEIMNLGHRIGLHFDASLYQGGGGDFENVVDWECETLSRLLRREVDIVSFHRPAEKLLNLSTPIAGRIHTYQTAFFSDIGYCSDSRGGWRYGHPLKHEAVAQGHALQLLTHPIWWTGQGEGPQARLDEFADQRDAFIRDELERNCESYKAPTGQSRGFKNE